MLITNNVLTCYSPYYCTSHEARAQSLHHGRGGEVLGRDELDAAAVFGEMGEGREGERREKEARVGTDWRVLCRRAG